MTTLTRPPVSFRHRLKAAGIEIKSTQTVPSGRIMWCSGRKVLRFGNLDELSILTRYPSDANTVCLSPADYAGIGGE